MTDLTKHSTILTMYPYSPHLICVVYEFEPCSRHQGRPKSIERDVGSVRSRCWGRRLLMRRSAFGYSPNRRGDLERSPKHTQGYLAFWLQGELYVLPRSWEYTVLGGERIHVARAGSDIWGRRPPSTTVDGDSMHGNTHLEATSVTKLTTTFSRESNRSRAGPMIGTDGVPLSTRRSCLRPARRLRGPTRGDKW